MKVPKHIRSICYFYLSRQLFLVNIFMSLTVYIDSTIIENEWLGRLRLPEYRLCKNLVEFESDPADKKIAIVAQRLHCDNDEAYIGFETKINRLAKISNVVFSIESELHNFHWAIFARCHHENVFWLLPGFVNDREDINKNIICWGDWFKTTANLYKALPGVVEDLHNHSYQTKPKYFDMFLGSPKPHRDFVFKSVQEKRLFEKVVITYGGDWKNDAFYAEDYFVWEPGCTPLQPIIGTADFVEYKGQRTHLSQVISVQTMKECAYSVIAETDYDNTLTCFTEKSAKPVIAKRMFIAYSGYKFLQNFRRLGFKTFDCVIDESYDLEIDDQKRYTMAFEQIERLMQMDQQEVYAKLKPVLDHNYELLMNRDWDMYSADQMQLHIDALV